MDGEFITVEGIDGAGKTEAVKAIKNEFDVITTHDVATTHEPSEFWTGKQVRRALQEETPAFTDFFLFMADRHYHIEKLIKPELEKGNIVVSDRFADSTYAYQPFQLEDELNNSHRWIEYVMYPWIIIPDLTIYIDISVATALRRSDGDEKYEDREMLEHVKANYDLLSIVNSGRYKIINGEQSKDKVKDDVIYTVKNYLASNP